jgi:hypothetical protein
MYRCAYKLIVHYTISNVNFTYSKGTFTLFKLIGKWIGVEGYRLMQGRKGEAEFKDWMDRIWKGD